MVGDLVSMHKASITEAIGGQAAVNRQMGAGTEVLDGNPILDDDGDRFLIPVMKEYETRDPQPAGTGALSRKELFVLSMIHSRVSNQIKTKKLQLNPQEQKSFDRVNLSSKNWGPNFLRFLMLMNNKPALFGRFARRRDLPMIQAMQRRMGIAPPLRHEVKGPGHYKILTVMTADGAAAQRLEKTANAFPQADPALSVNMAARTRVMGPNKQRRRTTFAPPLRTYQLLNDMPQPPWLNERLKKDIEAARRAEAARPSEPERPANVAKTSVKPSTLAYTG